jgi:CRP-like cAMP-binding protein
LQAAEVLTPP